MGEAFLVVVPVHNFLHFLVETEQAHSHLVVLVSHLKRPHTNTTFPYLLHTMHGILLRRLIPRKTALAICSTSLSVTLQPLLEYICILEAILARHMLRNSCYILPWLNCTE